jgi:predicted ArsR family transcriptional regulator
VDDFVAQVEGVSALAEPVRRALYLYVAGQPDPVSRDQASDGVGVARHTAKFHLDRLVADGLLETDFKRPPGRTGPGAGRPTKRYRRAAREVSVTLPERRYDLAGQLMAAAIEDSARDGTPVVEALDRIAATAGAAIGAAARARITGRASRARRLQAACESLAEYGYEPRQTARCVELANCPFHALAREHTELVCGMNHALVGAAVAELGDAGIEARLDPGADRCCVILTGDHSA